MGVMFAVALVVILAASFAIGAVVARCRRCNVGEDVVVHCRRSHLLTTIWLRDRPRRSGWVPRGGSTARSVTIGPWSHPSPRPN
jgi:hypothetical protein